MSWTKRDSILASRLSIWERLFKSFDLVEAAPFFSKGFDRKNPLALVIAFNMFVYFI